MSFSVMTDTSGNLPQSLILDNNLRVIPFSYYINGKEYNTVKDPFFDAEDFYARIRRGMKVTTSQIPPQQYADFFETELREGNDVIFVAMSSGISGSCNSAQIAARMMMDAYPGRIQHGFVVSAVSFLLMLERDFPLVSLQSLQILTQQNPAKQTATMILEWPAKGGPSRQ